MSRLSVFEQLQNYSELKASEQTAEKYDAMCLALRSMSASELESSPKIVFMLIQMGNPELIIAATQDTKQQTDTQKAQAAAVLAQAYMKYPK